MTQFFLTKVWRLLNSWQDPRENIVKKRKFHLTCLIISHSRHGLLANCTSGDPEIEWAIEKKQGNATHCWNQMKVQLFFHYMNVCCIPPTPAVPIETFAWLNSEFFTWRKRFLILYFKNQLFIWRCTSIIILFQLFLLYYLWIIFNVSNTDHICESWVCHQTAWFGFIELHFTAKKKDTFNHTQASQAICNKIDKIGQNRLK